MPLLCFKIQIVDSDRNLLSWKVCLALESTIRKTVLFLFSGEHPITNCIQWSIIYSSLNLQSTNIKADQQTIYICCQHSRYRRLRFPIHFRWHQCLLSSKKMRATCQVIIIALAVYCIPFVPCIPTLTVRILSTIVRHESMRQALVQGSNSAMIPWDLILTLVVSTQLSRQPLRLLAYTSIGDSYAAGDRPYCFTPADLNSTCRRTESPMPIDFTRLLDHNLATSVSQPVLARILLLSQNMSVLPIRLVATASALPIW